MGFRRLPGAIVLEYVSTNGRTLTRPPDDWNITSWKDPEHWFAVCPRRSRRTTSTRGRQAHPGTLRALPRLDAAAGLSAAGISRRAKPRRELLPRHPGAELAEHCDRRPTLPVEMKPLREAALKPVRKARCRTAKADVERPEERIDRADFVEPHLVDQLLESEGVFGEEDPHPIPNRQSPSSR